MGQAPLCLLLSTCEQFRSGIWDKTMHRFMKQLWKDTQGQDLVEYALCAGMVAVAAVAAMPALSTTVNNVFSKIASIITSAVG
jgi:pilus assembly protein Flp/PilA